MWLLQVLIWIKTKHIKFNFVFLLADPLVVISLDPPKKVQPEADFIVEIDNQLTVDPDLAVMQAKYGIDAFSNNFDPNNLFTHHRTYDGTYLTGHLPMSSILINERGWHNQTEMRTIPHKLPLTSFKAQFFFTNRKNTKVSNWIDVLTEKGNTLGAPRTRTRGLLITRQTCYHCTTHTRQPSPHKPGLSWYVKWLCHTLSTEKLWRHCQILRSLFTAKR